MDLTGLAQEHVYIALVLGSLVEGETTVVLAGYAAHQGYAPFWSVALLAGVVNFLLDLGWYALGRWHGPWLLARWPALRRGVAAVMPRLQAHRRRVIFLVRFMYGLRTAGPIALGIARVPLAEFALFNALGAAIWAPLFAGLGYLFGRAVTLFLHRLAHYELLVAGVLAALVLVVLLWRHIRRRQARRAG